MPLQPKPAPLLPAHVLDKVAVVTGASGPIGAAVAEGFAQAGASVVLVYGRDPGAVQTAKMLSDKNGVQCIAMQLDVRDFDATKAAIDAVVNQFGHLDIWVANAGVAQDDMTIINGKKADWENIIQTNYTSIVYQASLLGSVWQAQGSGNLIITASGAATSTIRPTNQTLYNSSKAAAKSLARSLAQEFKDFARYMGDAQGAPEAEIDNALSRQVLNRTGEYRELQGAYLYLASAASTFCTGHDLVVDGGYTL
ncbi:Sorbitol utilization protein SOU1 [Saitozyma sp. JCM 24511]|nr:Sorbitol utilization protein SOU1 [Saitozyma sp. JCM 24511]